jgi:hypothetical protein
VRTDFIHDWNVRKNDFRFLSNFVPRRFQNSPLLNEKLIKGHFDETENMQNSKENDFLANETMKKIGFILLFCILQFHWIYSFRSIGYPTYTSLGRRSNTLFLWKKNDKNKEKDTPKVAPQRNTEKEIKKETVEKVISLPNAKKEVAEKATSLASPEKEARKEALTGVLTQIERSYGKGTIQKLGGIDFHECGNHPIWLSDFRFSPRRWLSPRSSDRNLRTRIRWENHSRIACRGGNTEERWDRCFH